MERNGSKTRFLPLGAPKPRVRAGASGARTPRKSEAPPSSNASFRARRYDKGDSTLDAAPENDGVHAAVSNLHIAAAIDIITRTT